MKYDEQLGKLKLTAAEMVKIAKRGITPTAPYDEDEEAVTQPSLNARRRISGDAPPQKLYYDVTVGEYNFEILAKVDIVNKNEITLITTFPRTDAHPKKSLREITRAEGFICGYCLSEIERYDSVVLKNIYINEESFAREETQELISKKKLSAFFEKCKASLLIYATPEIERVTKRLPTLRALKFPYKELRAGQGEMVREVYRAIASSTSLIAEAPTGTGKTASVIFPALRALGDGKCDKVFYFTPKTTTANAVKSCLELIAANGGDLRAVIITAKEKICLNKHVCKEGRELCDFSKENKLPDAVLHLYRMEKKVVTEKDIRKVAKEYAVCPYELTLCYSEICDLVICDFNYLFDPSVYIKRFFTDGGNYAFLIDEAHNLPERAREMYSCEMSIEELYEPASLISPLGEHSKLRTLCAELADSVSKLLYSYLSDEIRENEKGERCAAAHMSDVPYQLYDVFSHLETVCFEELMRSLASHDEMQRERTNFIRTFSRKIKKLNTVLGNYDEKYETFIFMDGERIRFKLYCIDTGGVIASRVAKGKSAVFFSATLTPMNYYRALLGVDGSARTLTVGSPFDPSQLSVSIIDKISTRFSERDDTMGAICRTIAATVSARRGNYMIFSPSFAYSERLSKMFCAKYPKIKVLCQSPNMTAQDRAAFLAEFEKDSPSYLIGFCVMGGVYSEGVDLEGDKLIGAVVVGIGMPTLSYEREAMASYFEEKYEEGKQYAYIYPGINRVLQAAGRVIRGESDRGVIVLIDDRFQDPIYKKSAPDLWKELKYIPDAKALKEELEGFWRRVDEEKK